METKEIRPFVALCNNFIDAKYIMMGNNIVKLIECINSDESLRNVVKKCMVDFDFTTELGLAISGAKSNSKNFVMPNENVKIVALCYSILQQIALNEIDYEAFISKHFLFDGTIYDVYANFGHYFILPFKNALLYLENAKNISLDSVEEDDEMTEETKSENVDNYDELREIVLDMERVIESDCKIKEDKEDDLKFYIIAFKEALKLKNKILIYALGQILLEKTERIKSLRGVYERLNEACDNL